MLGELAAARLIKADYDGVLDVLERIRKPGRCFTIVRHKGMLVGICRGTTDKAGWRVNLDFLHKPWPSVGESGDEWHKGWIETAQEGADFFRGKNLSYLTGHSLGAARAQIIALSLGMDAVTFAAPKPLWRRVSRVAPTIVNHCRTDDLVCRMPPIPGYRRLGKTIWHHPRRRHLGEDHGIRHYIAMLDGSEACETVEERAAP